MVHLPVSGLEAAPRQPDGSDELVLREMTGSPVAIGIALVERLAGPGDRADLTVTDFEILLLAIRTRAVGEDVDLGLVCPGCGERVAIGFRASDYVRGLAPRRPVDVTADPERPGWFRLAGARFRLPTAADQATVAGRSDAAKALAERCLDPPAPSGGARGRIERAMATMAPEVSRPVAGRCPECGAAVEAPIHVTRLVIGEMKRDAAGLHEEIDLIAQAYHWSEADILALPRRRRQAYAESIRLTRRLAA
jgi:DNA-directed RNA polymerase subunit RPC12/RpoP